MPIIPIRPADWPAMRRAGRSAATTLAMVGQRLRAGVTAADIDAWVREDTAAQGGVPAQLGYHGFPGTVCVSPNHVVCHGIPRPEVVLGPGDIVSVDVTTRLAGWHGDTCGTFTIGTPSPEARHVMETARRCRDAGIAAARVGGRLGDVGAAITALARQEGCSVVHLFGGHGIGRFMHMAPHVDHTAAAGTGPVLRVGMAFTVEPMINLGTAEVVVQQDGWTVVTADGALSAQYEHTVLMTEDGPEILTLPP